MQLGIAEAVADCVNRYVVLAELALGCRVGTIIRQISDLIQRVNLLSEDLLRHCEDCRNAYNSSTIIINTLTCAEDRLAGCRGSEQQQDMLALDHHL